MSLSPDRAEAHARDLARFQAIAMHAAEKAHAAIEAADDAAELCDLIGAVSKAGRVLRMSIALEAKLARDQGREAREDEARTEARTRQAVEARKAQVTGAVDRMIWTERERDDAEVATAELYERLDAEALTDAFLDEPVEAQVERIAGVLGLTGEPAERYMPRALRHQPHRFHKPLDHSNLFGDLFDADEDEDGEDDDDVPGPDPPPAHPPPAHPPPPDPEWKPGRLAPPMDLPSWECE